jgi:hypothetical protein
MRIGSVTNVALWLALAGAGHAAPPIELELATERGVQITAPHEWLQLLAAIGVHDVRIRGIQPGDEVTAVNRGSADRPRYHVVGLLTRRDQLRLPGGTFSRGERARIKDYFDRLAADGADAITAERGRFGLTEQEMAAVVADFTQPIDFETEGQSPQAMLDRIQSTLSSELSVDSAASHLLRAATPIPDELKGVATGTGLAIALRSYGAVLQPQKLRGQPVVYRIMLAEAEWIKASTLGKNGDEEIKHWPVGWELPQLPGETVPALFEQRNAEIDGYTLEETLAAINSRINVPMFLDHAALAAHKIQPAKVQIQLQRTRAIYKRIIDRVLSQARLHSEIRVDEAGRPFLWITR